jgi:hypothetical protein
VINNWNKLLIKNLVFVFVDYKNDEKVLLNTYVHNMVCDEDKIEVSVKALFKKD